MPSLAPGFEYDIFISYRHNDNRSGWVTEFVKNLQEELSATIKEPVSVYFDSNPNDGLLETHNVDKSLEGKLKCLIFIPIISQTYCDPKSFAWQHEFCMFNKLAKEDQFGRDIKLSNGNVASRILPIRIHDLDVEDKILLEIELGGVLRPIDFIYKTTGVNRPLTAADKPDRNINNIFYRDQINKVANAVKEITAGVKNFNKPASSVALSKRISGEETPPKSESIAVMAFKDMSPSQDQAYLGDGLAEEIINLLSQLQDLSVIGRTSSFSYKNKEVDLKTIGKELGVSRILEGSIQKVGNRIRITAQLIDPENGFHIWSDRYNRNFEDVFAIQDDIAGMIAEKLKLSFSSGRIISSGNKTVNMEAYEWYMKGINFLEPRSGNTFFSIALECFEHAIKIDPEYQPPYNGISYYYFLSTIWLTIPPKEGIAKSVAAIEKAMALGDSPESFIFKASIDLYLRHDWDLAKQYLDKAFSYENNPKQRSYAKKLGDIAMGHRVYAHYHLVKGDNEKAILSMEKALASDPFNFAHLCDQGLIYIWTREFRKPFDIADVLQPLHPVLSYQVRGLASLQTGDYTTAMESFEKMAATDSVVGVSLHFLAMAKAMSGDSIGAEKILVQFLEENRTYRSHTILAGIYGELGKMDLAFQALDQAFHDCDWLLMLLKADPFYDSLRQNPRFDSYIKRMLFP